MCVVDPLKMIRLAHGAARRLACTSAGWVRHTEAIANAKAIANADANANSDTNADANANANTNANVDALHLSAVEALRFTLC